MGTLGHHRDVCVGNCEICRRSAGNDGFDRRRDRPGHLSGAGSHGASILPTHSRILPSATYRPSRQLRGVSHKYLATAYTPSRLAVDPELVTARAARVRPAADATRYSDRNRGNKQIEQAPIAKNYPWKVPPCYPRSDRVIAVHGPISFTSTRTAHDSNRER